MERPNTKNKATFSRRLTNKINRSVTLINCSHNAYDANIVNNDCMENAAICDNENAMLDESLYCSSDSCIDSNSYINVNISSVDNVDKLSNNITDNDSNTGTDIPLVSKLSKWAIEENITLSALKNLLPILRDIPGCGNLPKDPRTVMKTPSSIVVSTLASGTYYYFGIEKTLNLFCTNNKIDIQENEDFLLAVNIDGLPLSKSSNSSFWPILCYVKSIKALKKQVFLIALYHGSEKPKPTDAFLQDFVNE